MDTQTTTAPQNLGLVTNNTGNMRPHILPDLTPNPIDHDHNASIPAHLVEIVECGRELGSLEYQGEARLHALTKLLKGTDWNDKDLVKSKAASFRDGYIETYMTAELRRRDKEGTTPSTPCTFAEAQRINSELKVYEEGVNEPTRRTKVQQSAYHAGVVMFSKATALAGKPRTKRAVRTSTEGEKAKTDRNAIAANAGMNAMAAALVWGKPKSEADVADFVLCMTDFALTYLNNGAPFTQKGILASYLRDVVIDGVKVAKPLARGKDIDGSPVGSLPGDEVPTE